MTLSSFVTYPWVNFLETPRKGVSSNTLSIFGENYLGSTYTCIIDSIFICNTTKRDIIINVYTIGERLIDGVLTNIPTFRYNFVPIPTYGTIELIKGVGFNMLQGDLLYCYTNDPNNSCDTNVSYRELRETGTPTPESFTKAFKR